MNIKVLGATLLSKEEYEENEGLIRHRDIIFWLRSANVVDTSPAVGILDEDDMESNSYGVAPVLILQTKNLQIGSKITYAGQTFTVLKYGIALCDISIRVMPFCKDKSAEDANIYEVSDVKKWVDAWFSRNGDTAETIEE